MSRKRRSYESGHKAKYLVVIDDSAECDRAIYYASRRAARNNATVIMLRVIETKDRHQQWLGVADIMRAEAHEEANAALDRAAGRANGVAGITAERAIREGEVAQEILNLIEEDEDIATLILAASTGAEGPGAAGHRPVQDGGAIPDPGRHRPGPSERRGPRRPVLKAVCTIRPSRVDLVQ
jgi:nucleotide-binding universal stress UspA family protein